MTRFDPSGPLLGSLRPPADKSISHRAALIAAMGEDETTIEGYLDSADTRSTLAAVRALGARVEGSGPGGIEETIRIRGIGLRRAIATPIDVGNAGTLLRLPPGCGGCRAGGGASRGVVGPSTATTRSGAGRSTGSPSPWAGWAPG